MTDDDTPTPIPAPIATGSPSAWAALANPIGETKTNANSIAAARPSTPPIAERHDQQSPLTIERHELAPGAAPDGEDERRRCDPQPGDAEHVDTREEQDRE